MIAILSAPTNLGLNPPEPGAVPGTAKAPEALREAGLHERLIRAGAVDAGVVLPGRYVDAPRPHDVVRNQEAIVEHARRLAARLVGLRGDGLAPLVLGGDCSIAVGAGLATRVAGGGFVHVDGHTDFRHLGNSPGVGAVGGEGLAALVGRHIPAIADIDGLGPYVAGDRVAHIGCRDDDEDLAEVEAALALVIPASEVILHGGARAAGRVRSVPGMNDGYWIQVDVDVLDPIHMPAVDSPDPGGLSPDELIDLLRGLAPGAWGASVTIFDPDLDPDGVHARALSRVIAEGFEDLGRTRTG